MPIEIRTLTSPDIDTVVEFSVRAWAPVFESLQKVLGETIYHNIYPDWRAMQAAAVRNVCLDEANSVWVAEDGGRPVGFVAVAFHDENHPEPRSGEIDMLAVAPEHQRRGVAEELISFALDRMRAAGVELAVIATGGDPGHAPARRAYERAGFTAMPLVRYYMSL